MLPAGQAKVYIVVYFDSENGSILREAQICGLAER